jgi:hypothetical protein
MSRLLRKDDEFVQLKAAKIIVHLVLYVLHLTQGAHLPCSPLGSLEFDRNADQTYPFDPTDLFVWVTAQLQSTNPGVVDIAVQLLQSLLSLSDYRLPFYQTLNGVNV